jgi:lysosomal alpha-mannosidase
VDDDPTLRSFNAEEKMQNFINWLHTDMLKVHQGNHIILPWGCDFHFQNAEEGFSQTDKIINYINKHNKANIKLLYSTPSYFVSELK